MYGVRAIGANLSRTREQAQEAFAILRRFVRASDAEDLRERLKMSNKTKEERP